MQVYASDDAFVRGGTNADTKFGTTTPNELQVKNINTSIDNDKRESYLKFDLSAVPGLITGASLNLYGAVNDGGQATGKSVSLAVYSVADDTWSGAGITWRTKPAKDAAIASPMTLLNKQAAKWYSTDVSAYMGAQQLADMTASIGLIDESVANCLISLNSSEAANKPYLTVTYLPAAAGDVQSPTWANNAQLSAVLQGTSTVRLEWPQADDPSGIAGYRIYANDVLKASVPASVNTYTVADLLTGTDYSFRIEAADYAWNWTQGGLQKQVSLSLTEQKLSPTDDAYVNAGAKADLNFGSEPTMIVKKNNAELTRETLMKFDLDSAMEDMGSAVLYVYATLTDSAGTDIVNHLYSTDTEQWSEQEVTWNTRPGVRDYLQAFTANRTPQWYALDVTAYVKGQRAANKAASFLIRQEVEAGLNVGINSKENAANKPYLRITRTKANPSAPVWGAASKLTMNHVEEDLIEFSWAPATGADAYRVYANGILVDTVGADTTSYKVSGLAVGKSYTIRVEAGKGADWSADGPYATVNTLETKLLQSHLGNVYLSNEALSMKVQTGRTSVSWTATDVWGSAAASGVALTQNGEALITFPSTLRGYFTLTASAEADGRTPIVLETAFAVLTPFDMSQLSDSPFGVNSHLARTSTGWDASLTELVVRAGIKNVRDASEWNSVEPQKGVYTVPSSPAAAAYMDAFRREKIDQLWDVAFNNPLYDQNSTPYTDEGREGFANHARAVLDAYNGANPADPGYTRFLKQIEVFNEFNIGFGDRGTGPADSKPEYYFPLLKKTYETVKASHPDTTVVGMSTAGVPLSWMESVMKLGGLNYMDVVSFHPYVYPNDPELIVKSIDDVNALVRKYNGGKTKPLWISEIGWPTHATLSGVSEKKSADDLVRAFVLSLANGIEKVYWYDLMNDGTNATYNEDNFGLVRNKNDKLGVYTPKPSYTAFAVMIRQLSEAVFDKNLSAAGSYYHYLFKQKGEDVRVVWATQPKSVVIRSQSPVRVVDFMGNETVYTPVQGKVYMTLNGEPSYIRGAIDGIAENGTFKLTGESSLMREDGKLKLTVDNKESAAVSGTFDIGGHSYPFDVAAGAVKTIDIRVPGMDGEGSLSVRGKLMSAEGKQIGLLTADIPFRKPYNIQVKPVVAATPGADPSVQILIDNNSADMPLGLAKIDWSIGGASGSIPSKTIAPTQVDVHTVVLPGLQEGKSYPLDVTVYLDSYNPVHIVSSIDFNRVVYKEEGAVPAPIDVTTGTNRIAADSYTGKDDLSGTFSLSYDETNFYLDADIVDDTFQYPFVGQEIWKNDSIQFGVEDSIPGMATFYYEIGISMTNQGPQIYFFNGPAGTTLGVHDNGDMDLKITRDEEQHITKYRLKMPWRELTPIVPAAGNTLSFSMLVNENDNGIRDGYYEWGSGIGGGKDPTLFRAFQLMAPVGGKEPETEHSAELKALSVSAGELTPAFDAAQLSYSLSVANDVDKTSVSASSVDPTAMIGINGASPAVGAATAQVDLQEGDNSITVAVTAQGQPSKTYTITVNRKAGEDNGNGNPDNGNGNPDNGNPDNGNGNPDNGNPDNGNGNPDNGNGNPDNGNPDNGSPGPGSSGPASTPAPDAPTSVEQPDQVITTTEVKSTTDAEGKATAAVSNQQITDALAKLAAVRNKDKAAVLEIKATVDAAAKQAIVRVPAEAWTKIADSDADTLTISAGLARLSLDTDALKAVQSSAGSGTVDVSIQKVDAAAVAQGWTPQAKQALESAVGGRPIFDLTITAGGTQVSSFNGGSVKVNIPYQPAAGEDVNAILAYYVAANGELVKITNSIYDAAGGMLMFNVTHFSPYAVGYDKVRFRDTAASFAQDFITYLSARGIINGTAAGQFSPAASITRADFTLMLARMAGAKLDGTEASAFRDVAPGSYYAQSVRWATANGITNGVTADTFAPTANITREQMATMLVRYAALMKLSLPQAVPASDFADRADIAAFAAEAARTMQQAGIIGGKSGGRFAPKDMASREEAAKLLGMLQQLTIR
ncbi:CBM96 family carbohydrate-binding protein [Cohnella sp. 56]|uniref:CBM96 family carbohydrate-binding protein n=1 Tax=Cohnella sp. 56 TaxID=3113722 RepID=UPI0030E84BE6